MKTLTKISNYNLDLDVWVNQQIEHLKNGRYDELDLENLIEEIESVGKSQRRSIESYFIVLVLHLLKWKYQPEARSSSWVGSIDYSRIKISLILKDSPSLKNYLETAFKDAYDNARKLALKETGLPKNSIPLSCPFSLSYAMEKEINLDRG